MTPSRKRDLRDGRIRTVTLDLPADVHDLAVKRADAEGKSLGELVPEALDNLERVDDRAELRAVLRMAEELALRGFEVPSEYDALEITAAAIAAVPDRPSPWETITPETEIREGDKIRDPRGVDILPGGEWLDFEVFVSSPTRHADLDGWEIRR